MTRQTKSPNRVEQLENCLDRVERNLELLTEGQLHTRNLLDNFIRVSIQNSSELRQEMRFLLAAITGHSSQSVPPAHTPD